MPQVTITTCNITEEYINNNYDVIDAPLVLNKLRKEVTIVTVIKQ